MPMDVIERREFPLNEPVPDGWHSIGWPDQGACVHCGARAVFLHGSMRSASYECRGTPTHKHSAYGPDGCGRTFVVRP